MLILSLGLFAFFKIRRITIKFVYNNDSIIGSTSVKIKPKSKVNLITIERDGYIFEGWYLNDEKVDKNRIYNTSTVLVAKWLKTYKVTFDYGEKESISFIEGDPLELIAEPKKEGYTFVGWFDFFENRVEENTVLEPKDITLYARFRKINKE